MRQRIATMIAVAALLMVGVAPALAAGRPDNPGGNRGASADHIGVRDVEVGGDVDSETPGPPEWAKAYGWRIIDAFGLPYGQLLKCADDGEESITPEESVTPEEPEGSEGFASCDDIDPQFPDAPGASAFWNWNEGILLLAAEVGSPIVGL